MEQNCTTVHPNFAKQTNFFSWYPLPKPRGIGFRILKDMKISQSMEDRYIKQNNLDKRGETKKTERINKHLLIYMKYNPPKENRIPPVQLIRTGCLLKINVINAWLQIWLLSTEYQKIVLIVLNLMD